MRDALRCLNETDDETHAIQEAIDAWEAGSKGVELNDAFEQIRAAYHRKNG